MRAGSWVIRRLVAPAGGVLALAVLTSASATATATATGGPPPGPVLAGNGTVLTVDGLTRVDGAVRLVATLANRGSASVLTSQVARQYTDPDGCLSFFLLDPATGAIVRQAGRSQGSCRSSKLPLSLAAGTQVTFAVDLADPGGTRLDVLAAQGGVVRAVAVTGAPARSSADVFTLTARSMSLNQRSRSAGARLTRGKGTSIDLETDVLFAVDSATLSASASATLDAAVARLKGQPGRSVGVYGHTDSTGSSAHNQALSQKRAAAVQKALAQRLGPGWSFEVRGYGETRPLVAEVDDHGKVDRAARALNRRVELALS